MGSERARSRKKTEKLFREIIKKALSRPEELTVSEWAEKYRILDESSSIPGRWSNDVTPYLVEIMDCFNDPYIHNINFVKPSQVGGTEALINMLGWIVTQNPSPAMMVYPSDDLAKDISNDKLKPAFQKSKDIRDRFYQNSSKELKLKFKGMTLYLRGAASPSKLASKAIRYLFFDEIDKIGGASKKEASPYNLALERTKTFKYTRKIYTCSTPTLKTNYVWSLHEAADEVRHYVMPCPHCGEYIEFKWKQVIFDKDKSLSVLDRAKTAKYFCQECACEIENNQKPAMLRTGKWKTVTKRNIGKPESVSFWINSLYSIFVNWEDAAKEFLESQDDPEKLQNFVNSWLGEPWEDTKLKTSESLVLERQTDHEQYVIPEWTELLTGGVDVQENCLYWTIRAWGKYITSQNIAHGQAFTLNDIETIMNLPFRSRDGTDYIVNLTLLDSGYNSDDIYDFCANNSDWALPCKGTSNPMLSNYKLSNINKATSRAHGMNLVLVDGGKYKDMIASRLLKEKGNGRWLVYKDCDEEYAKQVTSEHKVNEKSGNRTIQIWKKKTSHADNHYLDCEVYAFAAADILGVRTLHLTQEDNNVVANTNQNEQEASSEEKWISENEGWLGGQ
ncbi:Phage terminase, large subunit GpA [Anaerosporobacter mobilis DSM 15930]|uniref:Phage terminase, large subunit GpA n=1 Tax=Anaerosporobacter mobilis DSM 15930 TaxID=1120996 RepID=A0A1M7LTN7_9FIRM|nr:terminase gpA endonuclease subunit [Anaerosporobacter mobilis]SHM81642.1 Phage terminase, large subunit GpA [Anaerosporobacter mobilis DSM 15930]